MYLYVLYSRRTPNDMKAWLSERVRQPIWIDRLGLTPRQWWLGEIMADKFVIHKHNNTLFKLHGMIYPCPHPAGSQVVIQARLVWGRAIWTFLAILMIGFILYTDHLLEPAWLIMLCCFLLLALILTADAYRQIRQCKALLATA